MAVGRVAGGSEASHQLSSATAAADSTAYRSLSGRAVTGAFCVALLLTAGPPATPVILGVPETCYLKCFVLRRMG